MSGCFWNCQGGPVVWVAFRPPKGLLIWFRIGNTSLNPPLTGFPVECKFGGAGLTTNSLTKLLIWGSATLHWLESPGFRVRSMSKEEMGNITSRPLLTVWKDTEQCCWVVRHNIGPNHACFLCISCDRTPRDGYCRTPYFQWWRFPHEVLHLYFRLELCTYGSRSSNILGNFGDQACRRLSNGE
jgi:hypothetical protein